MADIDSPINNKNVINIFIISIIIQEKNNYRINQLTSSLSHFNEDDDYNYIIETTQNIPFPSKPPNPPRHNKNYPPINYTEKYNNNTSPNHISQLEKKIVSQSKKISELEKYINLCENYIKKLNPFQTLPITEEMLLDDYEIIKDPINAAEQQNYIDLLKKTVENELIKNGLLNHNINAEGVIDLAKIRLESEEYKKQLVLAQSMINSLKNDLVELTKENEEYKMNKEKNININNNESINMNYQIDNINKKLINYKNEYEKISKDFEKLLNEKKNIKNENSILKKEKNNLKQKINDLENELNKINNNIEEKKLQEKINNIDYKKKYEELFENIKKEKEQKELNENKNTSIDKEIINYSKIKEENDKLLKENKRQKEDIKNLLIQKDNIEKENEKNKTKIIELNKNYEKEKEELKGEIKKLNEKNIEKENDKENYNYYIDDTDDEYFIEKKKDDSSYINPTQENQINLPLNEKYNELNNKYNDILKKYTNLQKERDKIKQILKKNIKNNVIKDNKDRPMELKKLLERSIDFKNNDNDLFDLKELNLLLWEKDEEIKEKEKIINENRIKKEELENEIEQKLKYYDEYITNNKINIKNLLSQLFNLLVQFKEKIDLKNNIYSEYISSLFIYDVDKIINQINAINNMTNYDIELNDNIFFETINTFISLLNQLLIIIYNKNYNYKKFCFNNSKNEEIKNNTEELISHINYMNDDKYEMFNSELKIKNITLIKENSKIKNEIINLDNKLKEITIKYNCNQRTVLINNEGKKNLLNYIYEFIKNISNKELVKIMYDILNTIDQLNITELNKYQVEEKLNVMKYNENMIDDDNNEIELNKYLFKEKNKLQKLIDDYDNKIKIKNNMLLQLNEEYNKRKIIYLNYIKELKEKSEYLINDNEKLRNKLIKFERNNNLNDKNLSEKGTYQENNDQIYNKTMEVLHKNKINNFYL